MMRIEHEQNKAGNSTQTDTSSLVKLSDFHLQLHLSVGKC